MADLIALLRHMQCEPASFDVELVASAAERAADALAANDREIARLYEAQGGVDVQGLMGHSSPEMTAVYRDSRGAEYTRVAIQQK